MLRNLFIGALLLTVAAANASARPAPDQALAQAERLYKQDRLAAAEPLYRIALEGAKYERRRAFDQLLALYVRLGRHDQAIQTGRAYEQWLSGQKDNQRLLLLALQMGECYVKLNRWREGGRLVEESLAEPGLRPAQQARALTLSAVIAEQGGGKQADLWRKAEALARRCLADGDARAEDRLSCAACLAECYRRGKDAREAVTKLREVAEIQHRLKDPAGRRETLRLLAERHSALKQHAAAFRCLMGAADLHAEHFPEDRLTAGELCSSLAEAKERLGDRDGARRVRDAAIEHFRAVMKDPSRGRAGQAGALTAYWRLYQLYQRNSQFAQALELSQAQERDGGPLLRPKLRTEMGTLQTYLGSYANARDLLGAAVKTLEEQTPVNLDELPRAMHNLSVAEQALGQYDRAGELGRRVANLYRDNDLPTDVLLVESFTLQGGCLAQQGDYAAAIDRYREGIAFGERIGADRQLCGLWLNVALLHKAQGDLRRAGEACVKAREAFVKLDEPDATTLIAFDVAEASILAAQGSTRQAGKLATRALDRAGQFGVNPVTLLTTARHYVALAELFHGSRTDAKTTWQAVAKVQQEAESPLLPRTLNYLALLEELDRRPKEAEKLYREALALQKGKRTTPATHYVSLWRTAVVCDGRGEKAEAKQLLEQAIAVAEMTRLRTYGDVQQRAAYLAQFSAAFSLLAEWHVRDGEVEEAAAAIDRGRSRGLLDQLLLAGVDPLDAVPGEKGERFRRRDLELRKKLSAIRARAQLLPGDGLGESEAKQVLAEMERAQTDYADLWREVYNASPLYRALTANASSSAALEALRKRWQGTRTVMLLYHLGQRSQVLLLGDGTRGEAFELEVSAAVAEAVATGTRAATISTTNNRGLVIRPAKHVEQPPRPASKGDDKRTPLSSAVARSLINDYRKQVADPDFRATRGLVLRTRQKLTLPVQPPELPGDVFLPKALRQRLAKLKPEAVVVVPDGALHGFPLEAFLVSGEKGPGYVLDELPPLVYSPSASVLSLLYERKRPARDGKPSLLTVAAPAYPKGKTEKQNALSELRGELLPLPFTSNESKRVRQYFDSAKVESLEAERATEKAFRAAVAGKEVVHVAAHGFADERFGNLFGALALTPPAKATEGEDGFVTLHEIYRLPLSSCELAVLSACETHVGPQLPLESGITLSSGFLAAGARRVVASHWNVEDQSTSALMGAFFAETMKGGTVASPARSLWRARQEVRKRPGCESPFYWAPFVLVGPPDEE